MHTNKQILAQQIWLALIIILVGAMVVVGGATRLTNSGLSITEWQPIMGAIPPLTIEDWQIAFDKYKQIPEYLAEHADMDLEGFKFIFWWEWGHRFLGRFVGIVWFVPFVYFAVRRQAPEGFMKKYILLGALGGLQGFMGWYMVTSGLAGRVDVSQYRLAAHLGLAFFIILLAVWFYLQLGQLRKWSVDGSAQSKRSRGFFAWFLLAVIFTQIIAGAFVAGTHAGYAYNTWPLMDEAIIPSDLYSLSPLWKNFFEDVLSIQFNHRMIAYFLILLVGVQSFFIYRNKRNNEVLRRSLYWVKLVLLIQIALGIVTLLSFMHIHTALTHQFFAVILLIISVSHIYKIAYEFD